MLFAKCCWPPACTAWGQLSRSLAASPSHPPLPPACCLHPHPFASLQILICGGTTFLFARQAACAAGNLTTNELLLRGKYGYLQAPADRTFTNPFDEGPANNCIQVGQGWLAGVAAAPGGGQVHGAWCKAGQSVLVMHASHPRRHCLPPVF